MHLNTLLLDTDTWDLCVDASGNIAKATEPYSLAQDAASACRLFSGELFYDTTKGIPYFEQILGYAPPVALMKAYWVRAALTVPGVVTAQAFVSKWENRVVSGQIQVTHEDGTVTAANIST